MAAEGNRYTFSTVMNFLIDLEGKLADLYKGAVEEVGRVELREIFLSFSKRNLERRELLNRMKRETVLEMTLEPITGLGLEYYTQRIEDIIKDGEATYLDKSVRMEEIIQGLYDKVSGKVMYMSAGISETLKTLSQESVARRDKLEDLQKGSNSP